MTMKIILESDGEKQVEITLDPSKYDDKYWEKVCDATGNNIAREAAIRWLEFIEAGLFHTHAKELEVEGFRSRQRATAFGKFSIRRRLYSEKGNDGETETSYHFLLDEHLNWTPYVRRTPDTAESLVSSCTKSSFREVSRQHSSCELSKSTIHSTLQRVAESCIQHEKQERYRLEIP